jgi:hypothetical protein
MTEDCGELSDVDFAKAYQELTNAEKTAAVCCSSGYVVFWTV